MLYDDSVRSSAPSGGSIMRGWVHHTLSAETRAPTGHRSPAPRNAASPRRNPNAAGAQKLGVDSLARSQMRMDASLTTRAGPRSRYCTLAVGEAPFRSTKPAAFLGNLLAAIEACNLLPATLREGRGQRTLRRLVAASGARKDRNRRNPGREV